MDWTYAAIMLAAVTTGWALFRRQPQPPELLPWHIGRYRPGGLLRRHDRRQTPLCAGRLARLPQRQAAWLPAARPSSSGLVGGYFGAEAHRVGPGHPHQMCDAFAVPLAVGIAIGRLGCFHAGCCHGTPTTLPWGVDFGDGVARHPTQLYESAFHLSAAIVLWQLQRRGMFRGPAYPPLPGGLLRLSLRHGIHPSRADDLAGTDRLSTGGAGADAVFRAVVLSRLSAAVARRSGDCPDFRAATRSGGPKMGLSPFVGMPTIRATGC